MTWYHGKSGTIKVGGTNVIGEIQNFEITQTAPTARRRAMGKAWADAKSGIPEWNGSINVLWDPADVGQLALVIGTSVALTLYPQGEGSGNIELAGNAEVSELGLTVPHDDGIEQAVTIAGDGALTQTTLA